MAVDMLTFTSNIHTLKTDETLTRCRTLGVNYLPSECDALSNEMAQLITTRVVN